ncbi:hypothetical protein Mapa_004665 [Marchantia paleacea]|nr:hypothetical protein Mapa_004665 [Marchantia paleacea]
MLEDEIEAQEADKRNEMLRKRESLLEGEEKAVGKEKALVMSGKAKDGKAEERGQELESMGKKKKLPAPTKTVSFIEMFKYADPQDYLLMVGGTIGAIGDGLTLPAALFITSGMINAFGTSGPTTITPAEFEKLINKYVLRFFYLAFVCFAVCFLEATCWMRTGERQASRLRSRYLRAILRQNQGFFDTAGADTAEVVNSVTTDTLTIQDAISEKVGHFMANISTFIGGYIVGFYLVWKMSLILLAFSPLLIVPGIVYGRTLTTLARKMQSTYLDAGTIAEQAISSIRTVYSFVGEEKTKTRFAESLDRTVEIGKKMGLAKGFAVGLNGINFGLWGFMSWYGSKLVMDEGESGGKIITAGLAMLTGGLALGTALPNLKYFSEGQSAATRIFDMIDRVPPIDSDNMTGRVLSKLEGRMELRNVDFAYPSRMDSQIFKNFCLTIPSGLTVALVGGSGSGKSTVIALLERFYDPLAGEVLIDGINIKEFQLKWLRTQIGLVSQEPALFATTIKENIMFGKEGSSVDEVIKASKAANAHHFISSLPEGYDTQVGERGVQMSGGQKQRIAIARALLKNPPILLLDEATSALDSESEKIVQEALDAASVGRTTIVVAHRLSTIQNSDLIAVVSGGQVVEQGTHESLLWIEGGAYASLVNLQQARNKQADGVQPEDKLSLSRSSDRGEKSGAAASWRRSSSVGLSMSQRLHLRSGSSGRVSFSSPRPSGAAGAPDADPEEKQAKPPSFSRLLAMNKPEWREGILGTIGAVGFGVVQPMYAFVLGSMISTLYLTDYDKLRREVTIYAAVFGGLAVACFIVNFLQHYYFAAMGELLTKRIRLRMLSKVLTFEVGWFDRDENSSGAICGRLASEANVVRALVGDRISLVIQTIAAIMLGSIGGLIISWKLSVVMIAVQPLVIVCYYSKKVLLKSMYNLTQEAQEEASQVASEAVIHHRTITAYSAQEKIMALFEDMQLKPRKESKKRAYIAGLGLGAALFATYCTWALDFWWGGQLVKNEELSFGDLFKCFFILVASGRMIAEAGSMTSDLAKGANSIVTVFNILDRKTKIDPDDSSGVKLEKIDGNVELKGVDFAYPARPDVLVFRGFDLKVRAGKNVALVGQSGSGKSTIIGLIERFYDPLKGKIMIDSYNIKEIHLRTLRSHIALVGQEPTLFAGTIRENILYGRDNATEAEIIEAAKAANAFSFISTLKEGFDTNTGERGVQLSGGQKQRIAIARAILKNPGILLLDEATSALDAHSEKTVQDALDRIMVGRTTIVVAHRLSTIQNCDTIAVIQSGAILEKGTHGELLAKGDGGAYFNLVKLQRKEPQH